MRAHVVFAALGALGLVALGASAYLRSGLLDLPAVPSNLTAAQAGLADFPAFAEREAVLRGDVEATEPHLKLAAQGIRQIESGEHQEGLELLHQAVRAAPKDLVVGNALRMQIFQLKRDWVRAADGTLGPMQGLPPWLDGQPVEFLRQLVAEQPRPELQLQLASALLDEMLLVPALEVRAGVTVEAAQLLGALLSESPDGNPYFLPARYARGLVYLHRPANLLWTQKIGDALEKGADDLALCVAIGRQIGVGSEAVRSELALALGDTYAKEGKASRARSWWQIADAVGPEAELRSRVMERMTWRDYEMIDRLEETLGEELRNLDRPLSDMSLLWR